MKTIENMLNSIINDNCLNIMKDMEPNSIELTLTDIPYEKVNKKSNGLREINKKEANKKTFKLSTFLTAILRITKGSGYIFCGKEQISPIFDFFNSKKITTRLLIWEKKILIR